MSLNSQKSVNEDTGVPMKRRKVFVFILSMAILFQSGFGVLASEISDVGESGEKAVESQKEETPEDGGELEDEDLG